jgi:peptidyl-prolyl cis-trans isomerase A (cyclophilin A)/peptidyl-prolyl cis-trans isomerase B (cyclophilin B)
MRAFYYSFTIIPNQNLKMKEFKMSLKEYDISTEALKDANYAIMKTSKGEIKLKLYKEEAPITVANFQALVNDGFYNGLSFHRVIPGFMAQGGCPQGTGTGGPGWSIKCETSTNVHKHEKGTLSMAHAGPNTGGSQFFICFVPCPHLDGVHTVFGGIEADDSASMAVLDSIEGQDKIESVEIVA